jgi:hypothetical protein
MGCCAQAPELDHVFTARGREGDGQWRWYGVSTEGSPMGRSAIGWGALEECMADAQRMGVLVLVHR